MDGKGDGEELRGVKGEETVVKIHYMRKNLFSIKENEQR